MLKGTVDPTLRHISFCPWNSPLCGFSQDLKCPTCIISAECTSEKSSRRSSRFPFPQCFGVFFSCAGDARRAAQHDEPPRKRKTTRKRLTSTGGLKSLPIVTPSVELLAHATSRSKKVGQVRCVAMQSRLGVGARRTAHSISPTVYTYAVPRSSIVFLGAHAVQSLNRLTRYLLLL